eukprot:CAMPEP_0181307122 /NCGR_PEP_ID=MMETSP1101-20121128/10692_1 /TAXON_ID=46948 /ORGANISM="Rhodomonas abbreviata, Strain Caron Lab Isolate" /LENGTH=247 /DNA_ID=CAMNT_0023413279 /DNA_START=81 /DNA_END=821 /DNA_ORIENTATION=-
MSLYASREGALYQSYDNYAGAQGFYDPEPARGMPAPPAGVAPQQAEQYAQVEQFAPQFAQPQFAAQSPQQLIFQEFQDYYRQPQEMMPQQMMPQQMMVQPHEQQMQVVQRTVMVPIVRQQPVVQQVMQPFAAPVSYTQDLRGVGIKFGERIDPNTGGMHVYVKRIVKGGPADANGQIQPGDSLLLINGEDVYGLGLDVLRNKIPGPANTSVRLGFKNGSGQLYETNLIRTAYGSEPQQQQQPQQPQP